MVKFSEIEEARKLLRLGETATLKEIKSAYRRMAQSHHPDKLIDNGQAETETMKRLNWAYKLLLDYCAGYKYSFRKDDVARTYPYDEYMESFKEKWFNSI